MTRFEIVNMESGELKEVLFSEELANKFCSKWNRKADIIDPEAIEVARYEVLKKEHDDESIYKELIGEIKCME